MLHDNELYDLAWGPEDQRRTMLQGMRRGEGRKAAMPVRGEFVSVDELVSPPPSDTDDHLEPVDEDDMIAWIFQYERDKARPKPAKVEPPRRKYTTLLTLKKQGSRVNYGQLSVADMEKAGWPSRVLRYGNRAKLIFCAPNGVRESRSIAWNLLPYSMQETVAEKMQKLAEKLTSIRKTYTVSKNGRRLVLA
ncbi:hypothetical protein L0Y69_02480 [bacterium]|nr:hypothetical protein [bacterium]